MVNPQSFARLTIGELADLAIQTGVDRWHELVRNRLALNTGLHISVGRSSRPARNLFVLDGRAAVNPNLWIGEHDRESLALMRTAAAYGRDSEVAAKEWRHLLRDDMSVHPGGVVALTTGPCPEVVVEVCVGVAGSDAVTNKLIATTVAGNYAAYLMLKPQR